MRLEHRSLGHGNVTVKPIEAHFKMVRVRPISIKSDESIEARIGEVARRSPASYNNGATRQERNQDHHHHQQQQQQQQHNRYQHKNDGTSPTKGKDKRKEKEEEATLLREMEHADFDAKGFALIAQEFHGQRDMLLKALSKRHPRDVELEYPADDSAGRLRYIGAIKNGKPHGVGSLTWVCGSRYDGMFRNDKLTGMGIYTWNNGKRYIGQWVDGKAHGYGTLTSGTTEGNLEAGSTSSMMEYSGMWQEGLMHGYGKLRLENGDVYEGSWVANNKHGRGLYCWKNGDTYEGNFINHQMHGKGIYSWPNGRKLEMTMAQNSTKECWQLSYFLWVFFTVISIMYVIQVIMEEDSKDPLDMFTLDYWLQFVYTALMWPFTMFGKVVYLLMGFLLADFDSESSSHAYLKKDPAANSIHGDDNIVGSEATNRYGMFEIVIHVLRHDLTLPHVRVALLVLLHSSLQEMFASIIFNVATWYVHVNNLRMLDDRTCWIHGLALGGIAVMFSSFIHMLIYMLVF